MSQRKIVLAADIGTSSLKAGFIDIAGHAGTGGSRLLAFVREPYPVDLASVFIEGRYVKLPAAEWGAAFHRALAALFRALPDTKIEAICISGNGPTLVPVAKKTAAPDAAQTLSDFSTTRESPSAPTSHRAVEIPESHLPLYWFGKTVAEPGAEPSFFLPHVAWFKQKYPERYESTAYFCSSQEWLSSRLGAEPVTVLPAKGYLPFYWEAPQCAAAAIDIAKFPPYAALGSRIGSTSAEAARFFGLAQGIPIIACGPDFIMSLLGAAVVRPGIVCDRAGSSEGINLCVSDAELRQKRRAWEADPQKAPDILRALRILPHAIDGLWNVSVVMSESGSIFERWREESGNDSKDYDTLLGELLPDATLALAAHGGASDLNAPDAPPPVLLQIAGQVKDALETLAAAGFPVREMRLSGGQGKSPRWNQFKASFCRCRLLSLEIPDAELAGDAAAAAFALGEASSIAEACENIVQIREQFE